MNHIDTWTGREVRALRDALRLSLVEFASEAQISRSSVSKWEAGGAIGGHSQRVLDHVLASIDDRASERFWHELHRAPRRADDQVCLDPRKVMMSAAFESAEDAAERAAHCNTESVADLYDQVVYIARGYSQQPVMSVFADARRVRDLTLAQVNRTHRPSDLVDLYVVLGQTVAIMGSLAFDLGNFPAAGTLTRSATTYADMAGEASLMAWTLGLQATLAFWRDEPEVSLDLIARGLSVAPPGAPRHRLRYIASRAHAVLHDPMGMGEVLAAARDDRDAATSIRNPLHDEVKGEFAFDDARAAACAAAAWLQVGDGAESARHAEAALAVYEAVPEGDRPLSLVTGTTIDLAAAHLVNGDMDAGGSMLSRALAVPQEQRTTALVGRMSRVRDILAKPSLHALPEGAGLGEQITDWLAATAEQPAAITG